MTTTQLPPSRRTKRAAEKNAPVDQDRDDAETAGLDDTVIERVTTDSAVTEDVKAEGFVRRLVGTSKIHGGVQVKQAQIHPLNIDVGSGVDPRMQARRADVQQAAKLRHKKTIVALLVVTAAAVGAMFAVQSPLLDVDKILITGAVQSDLSAVRDATAIEVGDALLELDLDLAAHNVAELPWVENAWIERQLNGDLTIHVEERIAFAVLPTVGEGFVVVDRSGRQLELLANRPLGFVPISGIEASGVVGTPAPPSAQAAMRLISSVSADLATHLERIYFDGDDLYLDLNEGGRVVLGSDSGLTDKLISLETMLERVDLRCLFEIDLRVPSAPALTRESVEGVIGASLTNLADCS